MHAHTHTHCCAPNHTMSHLAASLDCCVKHSGGPMTSSAPHKAPAPVLGFESPGEGGRVEWMVCTSARTALRVTKLHGNERVCVLMRGNPVSLGRTPGFRQLFGWRPQHALTPVLHLDGFGPYCPSRDVLSRVEISSVLRRPLRPPPSLVCDITMMWETGGGVQLS